MLNAKAGTMRIRIEPTIATGLCLPFHTHTQPYFLLASLSCVLAWSEIRAAQTSCLWKAANIRSISLRSINLASGRSTSYNGRLRNVCLLVAIKGSSIFTRPCSTQDQSHVVECSNGSSPSGHMYPHAKAPFLGNQGCADRWHGYGSCWPCHADCATLQEAHLRLSIQISGLRVSCRRGLIFGVQSGVLGHCCQDALCCGSRCLSFPDLAEARNNGYPGSYALTRSGVAKKPRSCLRSSYLETLL